MSDRFRPDSSYRRPNAGAVAIGGSPLRLFTVTRRGAEVLAAIEAGVDVPAGHGRLTDRLVEAGAVHPIVDHSPADAATLTVVSPCRGQLPSFVPDRCRTLVVDDASPVPLPAAGGVEVLRLHRNVGPGAARNAGLALVETPFVAFVDADVTVTERDLLGLLGHFADPRVAVVAPRIRAAGDGVLSRFDARHSPLDMGAEPARVAPTTRVSYLPAAVLVCRTDAVRAAGGFDPVLRYGEDVDLVWRLIDAGWRCRYDPEVEAHHRTRSGVAAWIAQRFRYGTSAAPLATRHPGALSPLRMNGWSAATWASVLAGLPVLGAVIGAGSTVALVRKLRRVPASESIRLAGLGHLYAGRLVAVTLTRAWWPITLVLALASRRFRRLAALAVVLPAVLDWRTQRPALDPARYVALRVLDDVAYGTGVWVGAATERSVDALVPAITPWPPRRADPVSRPTRRRVPTT